MTGEFDPYHRWLGIPAQEQPPNHYRLLGLVLFEDDLEVIRDAAERQMAHVRRYALGRHAELSQKILNELGAAKACLMDAAKKAAFDRRLREQLVAAKEESAAAKALPSATPNANQRPAAATKSLSQRHPGSAPVAPAGSAAVSAASSGQDARAPAGQDARPPVFGTGSKPAASPIRPPVASKSIASARPGPVAVAESPRPGGSVSVHGSVSRRIAFPRGRLPWIIGAGVALVLVLTTVGLLALRSGRSKPSDARTTAGGPEKPADDKANVDPNRWAIQPPKLAAIQDRTVDQGSLLRLPVLAKPGSASHLVYSLAAGKPEGAQIDPQSGLFTWTPSPAQRPGTYPITVQVSAPELGNVGVQTTFRVHVREVNRPPRLMPREDIFHADPGKPLRIHFQATDPDEPRDKLTFSLISKPEGAQLDPVSGVFTWTPTTQQADQSYPIRVRVTDNGPGALYDEISSTVRVNPRTLPPKDAYFRLEFASGRTLTSDVFKDLQGMAKTDAENAIGLYLKGLLVVVPEALVLWPDLSQPFISAVSNLKGGKLEGPTIAFHEPQGSGTRKGPSGVQSPGLPRTPTAAHILAPRCPDTPPKLYVTFRSEKWDGWLATWNEKGEKHYCSEYSKGKRNGLCCLFKEDRLAMVLECQADVANTVHLITANEIAKTFDSTEQAQGDSAAGQLLHEIDETSDKLKEDGIGFKKTIKRVIDARVAAKSLTDRDKAAEKRRRRDEENSAALKERMKKIRDGQPTR